MQSTKIKKKEAWTCILSQHHARYSAVERSLDDLKNRLTKLKSEPTECYTSMKTTRKVTGGGQSQKEPDEPQQKILD